MNSFVREHFRVFQMTQSLRNQLMALLTDDDLSFRPGGDALTLGRLCREMGETEYSYIQSFKTFKQDFSYRNDESGLDASVDRLTAWFKSLDDELNATIEGLSEDDLQKMIDRSVGFTLPARIQAHVYMEALLIFYAKASVYLRVMGKPLPEQWQEWIG